MRYWKAEYQVSYNYRTNRHWKRREFNALFWPWNARRRVKKLIDERIEAELGESRTGMVYVDGVKMVRV